MSTFTKNAGKFDLHAWSDGHPVSLDLEHEEPHGDASHFRLLGVEELHDLKHVVERMIALLDAERAK